MGCMCAKDEEKETTEETVQKKTYSWDVQRKSLNPKNFIIENLIEKEEIRLPGSVNGQQLIIQNCNDSTIYVLDFINTITIDECINCKIILGPVEGSTFIRSCKNCTCVVACGQFRMRDSSKINVFLFSATQPIIEASSGILFGRYQLMYNNIQEHFQKANININSTDSNWKVIYDFTPVECEENWNFMKNDKVSEYINEPKLDDIKDELIKIGHFWSEQENACTF